MEMVRVVLVPDLALRDQHQLHRLAQGHLQQVGAAAEVALAVGGHFLGEEKGGGKKRIRERLHISKRDFNFFFPIDIVLNGEKGGGGIHNRTLNME